MIIASDSPAATRRVPPALLTSPAFEILLRALEVPAVVGIRPHLRAYAVDDAFITFRYADNFSDGLGRVYNIGECVVGATAPAYAVVLAVLRSSFNWPPESASFVIGVLADGAATWLLIGISRLLDTAGIVSPESLAYYPLPGEMYACAYAVPALLILDLDPEYGVSLEVFMRTSLLPNPEFQSRYEEVYRQPTNLFGGIPVLVFQRVDHP